MTYQNFDDLPRYIKKYLLKFGWSKADMDKWLNDPVPALGNRSILHALSNGQRQKVNEVILRVGDAIGVEEYFNQDP